MNMTKNQTRKNEKRCTFLAENGCKTPMDIIQTKIKKNFEKILKKQSTIEMNIRKMPSPS